MDLRAACEAIVVGNPSASLMTVRSRNQIVASRIGEQDMGLGDSNKGFPVVARKQVKQGKIKSAYSKKPPLGGSL